MRDLEPVQRTCNSVTVTVDPRVELISIVQHISRYRERFAFLLNAETFPYRTQVEEQFAPYSDHPVVVMFDKVCGEWNECVSGYVIRAVTTYLAFQDSQAAGQAALKAEKARNVVLIDDLLDSVRQYAQNQDRYPTMDDYYPQLLEVFAGYAQDHKQ
jgi:hypothetical protein